MVGSYETITASISKTKMSSGTDAIGKRPRNDTCEASCLQVLLRTSCSSVDVFTAGRILTYLDNQLRKYLSVITKLFCDVVSCVHVQLTIGRIGNLTPG